ncbi:MAG TPA: peptidoglycan-binding protein, partial [Firmicutes bacterium]|nr:peptidoglycan-binding protein [Bacillota bacterium]
MDNNRYVAKKGESLYLIARTRGLETRQLAQANPDIQNVFDDLENQMVVFPDALCPNGFLYTIQAGDTYFQLAQRFGTT